jgi:hypothetical protein
MAWSVGRGFMPLRRAPSTPPPSAGTVGVEPIAESSGVGAIEELEDLPLGVEPWNGDEMPDGTASMHEQLAPPRGLHSGPPDVAFASADQPVSTLAGGENELEVARTELVQSLPPESEPKPESIAEVDALNHRQIYETRFRELELGEREALARGATGSELFALCLDPAPQVVSALLENSQFGLGHARSLAQHHPTDRGLEILSRRAQLVRDSHVQRRLLQNAQAPDVVLDRVLRHKRLIDIYRLSIDRDLPERNRVRVRSRLRPIFTRAEPEDRVALIMKTEGRCLANLSGCTFDSRTTQILCNQTIASALFIQNLARFPATPPALIAKLLRSAPVQRQPPLRALLMKHPNAGGESKRRS